MQQNLGFVETYSGVKFYPLNPRPEDINIIDIASGLSKICRYNGQCRIFFSVAQHSLNAMEYAKKKGSSTRIQLLALMHDMAEAYVSDIASPIKPLLPIFMEIEDKVLGAIYQAFDIEPPTIEEARIIKEIDTVMLATEAFQIMPMQAWDEWIYHVERDKELFMKEELVSEVRDSFVEKFFSLKSEVDDYVYCTNCSNFSFYEGMKVPKCKYEDRCNIFNPEDSMPRSSRPSYQKREDVLTKRDLAFYKLYQESYNLVRVKPRGYKHGFEIFDVVWIPGDTSLSESGKIGIVCGLSIDHYVYVMRYSRRSDRYWVAAYNESGLKKTGMGIEEVPDVYSAMLDWLWRNNFKLSTSHFKKAWKLYKNGIPFEKAIIGL